MVKLELISGGLEEEADFPITKPDGTPPKDHDWLRDIAARQVRFLCKRKGTRGSSLDSYGACAILPSKRYSPVMLYDFQVAMGSPFRWVDSREFSREHDLVATLPNPPEREESHDEHHLSLPEPREEPDDA